MKHCGGCDKEQLPSEFHKNRAHKDGLASQCKTCCDGRVRSERFRERKREYRVENLSRIKLYDKSYRLKVVYGIDLKTYAKMLKDQGEKCLICEVPRSECVKDFHVDHDHKSGKVRGLLCFKCNAGIGNLCDDVKIIERAIRYLRGELQFTPAR